MRFALRAFLCLLRRFLFASSEIKPDKKTRFFTLRFTFLRFTFCVFTLCVLRFCVLPLAFLIQVSLPFVNSPATKKQAFLRCVLRFYVLRFTFLRFTSRLFNPGIFGFCEFSRDKKTSLFTLRFTFLSDTFINFALCVLRFCVLSLAFLSRAYLPFAKSALSETLFFGLSRAKKIWGSIPHIFLIRIDCVIKIEHTLFYKSWQTLRLSISHPFSFALGTIGKKSSFSA